MMCVKYTHIWAEKKNPDYKNKFGTYQVATYCLFNDDDVFFFFKESQEIDSIT